MLMNPIPGPGSPAAPVNFVFSQLTPASTWSIAHPLNKKPSVTIVDSAGRMVFGEVSYVSTSLLTVSFAAAFSGEAYLN